MGLYYLAVSSTSSATPIVIAGGQTNSGVNFVGRLGNATCGTGTIAVTGHALAPDRSPLFRALVSVASTTGGQAASTESGLDGGWAVCLSSGSYSGQVSAPSSSYLTGSFSVTLSGSNEVVLRSGATLTGFILDPATNAAIPGVPVRLVGTNGSGTVQASGPDGHFRLDHDAGGGIAPGSWFLSADPSEIIDSP